MTNPTPSNEDLNSWKEIATYLGISVREAQNREKEGLPVYRLPGKKPRVWAVPAELDAWKLRMSRSEAHPEVVASSSPDAIIQAAPATGRPRWVAAGIMMVAIISIGSAWILFQSHASQGPVRAEVTGNTLLALDESGRTLWQHPFQQQLMDRGTHRTDGHPGRAIQIADLYGKGTRQVLFAATFAKSDGASDVPDYEELYCFSATGKILWQYKPKVAVTLGDTRFTGPWSIMDVLVVPGGSTPRIWLALAHFNWRPGVLLSMSPDGVPDVRFVDAGHIYAINALSLDSGRYILAGGINNEYNAAYVAVIRENAPLSCSPQTPGTRFECVEIPTVNAERYFVFPPTEVSIADGLPYNAVQRIQDSGRDSMIVIQEAARAGIANSMYTLSPSLEIRDVAFDDGWAVVHRRSEAAGLLRHTLAECPLLKAPLRIRRWDKASGWTTVEVPFKPGVGPDSAAVVK